MWRRCGGDVAEGPFGGPNQLRIRKTEMTDFSEIHLFWKAFSGFVMSPRKDGFDTFPTTYDASSGFSVFQVDFISSSGFKRFWWVLFTLSPHCARAQPTFAGIVPNIFWGNCADNEGKGLLSSAPFKLHILSLLGQASPGLVVFWSNHMGHLGEHDD